MVWLLGVEESEEPSGVIATPSNIARATLSSHLRGRGGCSASVTSESSCLERLFLGPAGVEEGRGGGAMVGEDTM